MQRFPWVLTVASAVAFAILITLGVWQVQRLQWKEGLIADLETRRALPAQPLVDLDRGTSDPELEWTRVSADCLPAEPQDTAALAYTLREGQIAWRLWSVCRIAPGIAVVVDRGFVDSLGGELAPDVVDAPPLETVVGLLRTLPPRALGERQPEPIVGGVRVAQATELAMQQLLSKSRNVQATGTYLYVAAEAETPAPAGITPQPAPPTISNKHLGYAITWFGLALALAGFYIALLRRKLKS